MQQTGSSLQRFKRKAVMSAESTASGAMSDEQKIRLQLQLDTEQVRQMATASSVSLDALDEFKASLAQSEA